MSLEIDPADDLSEKFDLCLMLLFQFWSLSGCQLTFASLEELDHPAADHYVVAAVGSDSGVLVVSKGPPDGAAVVTSVLEVDEKPLSAPPQPVRSRPAPAETTSTTV